MWTVVKYNRKKLTLMQQEMRRRFGENLLIYKPKLLIQKYKNNKLVNKEIDLMGDYLFCYHSDFKKKFFLDKVKFIIGVKYFLDGYIEFQKDLDNFIMNCKKFEDKKGFISQNIYDFKKNNLYKFHSGPFTDKIFKIIDLQKNKINILMGEIKATINKQDYFFKPI